MKYEKPKVTIDLEEYNDLIKKSESNLDPSQIATVAANIGLKIASRNHMNINQITEQVCRDLNYSIQINYNSDPASMDSSYIVAKVIKK